MIATFHAGTIGRVAFDRYHAILEARMYILRQPPLAGHQAEAGQAVLGRSELRAGSMMKRPECRRAGPWAAHPVWGGNGDNPLSILM